ncbi:MAG TPA: right-handed parallel beta-helix repeat-containing protein [Thermoanaerobaculia bacterium]|nr:right-handed parallel beta-helix repeat-containing protein [Thermoanaerobaculia bacterium]
MPTTRSLLLAALLVAGRAPAAAAGILFVDADLATGANDGSSWADAFQGSAGLQAALAAAAAGDQVFVAQGTYKPTETLTRSISFGLINGVEIYGSFLGSESSPAERPPFGTAPSVLSGDLAGDDGLSLFGDNSFHLVTTGGTNATAVLDGFVLRSGAATGGAGNQDRGGGILCVGGVSPTVRNCRFVGNRASFGGGSGYINNGAAPSFTDCSFEDGDGGSFGGAFDVAAGGAVRFERCRFLGNTAARAGALEIFSSTGVVVNDCLFTGNVATGSGGGGGLWMGLGGDPRVRNSTFVANESTVNAVAGLRNQGATAATVANCIFWDNVGPAGAQGPGNQVNAATLVDWSIVEGGFGGTGTGNSAGDPAFTDGVGGDFSLTAASAAIDAGSNTELQPGTSLDLALAPRLADVLAVADTGSGSAPIVDMGAFEAPSAWVDLGSSLAGVAGPPLLFASGTLETGSPGTLALSSAAPAAFTVLFVSLSSAPLPFKCGTLVPLPPVAKFPLFTSGVGAIPLGWMSWPGGLSGLSVYFQYAIQDAGAVCGVALSNALRGDVP